MRGHLITLEGIDGSGKTSVWRLLEDHVDATYTREPTTLWTGDAVNRAIESDMDPLAELFLFMADHAHHLDQVVRPALNDGRTVISDRYLDSRCAYQGVTLQDRFDDPVGWIRSLHDDWSIKPDLTILFVLSPGVAVERVGDRGEKTKFERIGFLEQVQENYLSLAEREPERFEMVDAEQSLEEVLGSTIRLLSGTRK